MGGTANTGIAGTGVAGVTGGVALAVDPTNGRANLGQGEIALFLVKWSTPCCSVPTTDAIMGALPRRIAGDLVAESVMGGSEGRKM